MALENIVGREARAPLAHRVRVRARARLRILVRAARVAAVRRAAPGDVARVVQRRRGARAAVRAGARGAGARTGCSRTPSRSGWGRSSCRRSWRTRRGTGCSIAGPCSPVPLRDAGVHAGARGERTARPDVRSSLIGAAAWGVFELYGRLTRGSRRRSGGRRRGEMMRTDAARWARRDGRCCWLLWRRSRCADQTVRDRRHRGVRRRALRRRRHARKAKGPSTLDRRVHRRAGVAGQGRLPRQLPVLPHAGVAHRRRPSTNGGAGSICRIYSRSSARGCPRTIREAWLRKTWPT